MSEVKYIRNIGSGRPTIKGIRVEVLHGRFVAGETIAALADDYELGVRPML